MQSKTILLFFILTGILKVGAQAPALSTADSLYAVGNYRDAIKSLDSLEPGNTEVALRLAKAHRANNSPDTAKFYYEKVLFQKPDKVLALMEYAGLLEKTGELQKADSIFLHLSRKYPENANFHYRLGVIKEGLKDSTAFGKFFLAVLTNPAHQAALFKVAKTGLKERKFYLSEKYSKQGLEHYPSNPGFISLLAQTYYHQQRYDLASENFKLLLQHGEENEFVYSNLGRSLYQLGNYEEAINNYLKALEYEEDAASNHLTLGKLYALTGDFGKSEIHLLQAIILRTPVLDEEYLSLALTYAEQKKYRQALKYLDQALEENPNNERALYERAIAADNYFEDLQTKINYYQQYLDKYNPGGQEPLIALARHRQRELRENLHLSEGRETEAQ